MISKKCGGIRTRVPQQDCALLPLEARLTIVRGQGANQQDVRSHISEVEHRSVGNERFVYFRFRGNLRDVRLMTVTLLRPFSDAERGGGGHRLRRVVPDMRTGVFTRYFVVHGATHELKRFDSGSTRHEYTFPPTRPSMASRRGGADLLPCDGDTALRARCPTTKREREEDCPLRNRLVKDKQEWEFVWEYHRDAVEKECEECPGGGVARRRPSHTD